MRPSSSSDSSAPHQTTTPVFIDFFAKEAAEQQERTATIGQQSQFAALNPRGTSSISRPDVNADAGPSAHLPVTVSTIRNFLLAKQHPDSQLIYDDTVRERLNEGNLSAETLLIALQTVHDANHPLLARLGVNDQEQRELVARLSGIVTNRSGFLPPIKKLVVQANNNPDQLIAAILEYLRVVYSNKKSC